MKINSLLTNRIILKKESQQRQQQEITGKVKIEENTHLQKFEKKEIDVFLTQQNIESEYVVNKVYDLKHS